MTFYGFLRCCTRFLEHCCASVSNVADTELSESELDTSGQQVSASQSNTNDDQPGNDQDDTEHTSDSDNDSPAAAATPAESPSSTSEADMNSRDVSEWAGALSLYPVGAACAQWKMGGIIEIYDFYLKTHQPDPLGSL